MSLLIVKDFVSNDDSEVYAVTPARQECSPAGQEFRKLLGRVGTYLYRLYN